MKKAICGNCHCVMSLKYYDTLNDFYIYKCNICGAKYKMKGSDRNSTY